MSHLRANYKYWLEIVRLKVKRRQRDKCRREQEWSVGASQVCVAGEFHPWITAAADHVAI